jgi:hypothetical protein
LRKLHGGLDAWLSGFVLFDDFFVAAFGGFGVFDVVVVLT